VLLQHLQDEPPSVLEARPDLPLAVGAVIARALAKDADERYASAGELARAFRFAFDAESTEVPSIPRLVETRRPVEKVSGPQSPPSSGPVSFYGPISGPGASDVEPGQDWFTCPDCSARLPFGAGICPACKYMIPLEQLPKSAASRYRIERREVVVNLLPQSIRWSPDGLQLARHLAAQALRDATVDGWEPASIGEPYRLVEGKTISGSVVESAILKLERVA
jgi:hypothetical protein